MFSLTYFTSIWKQLLATYINPSDLKWPFPFFSVIDIRKCRKLGINYLPRKKHFRWVLIVRNTASYVQCSYFNHRKRCVYCLTDVDFVKNIVYTRKDVNHI